MLRKKRNATSQEKKNCFGLAAPSAAEATSARTPTAPAIRGVRFHALSAGSETCSGRSATRSRSAVMGGSGLHHLDLARPERFEEASCCRLVELGVPRFDRDEEGVVARALEPRGVEERMVVHRQLVEA